MRLPSCVSKPPNSTSRKYKNALLRVLFRLFNDDDLIDDVSLPDQVNHVEPFDHFPEAGMLTVEVCGIAAVVADEKLRSPVLRPAWAMERTPLSWYWLPPPVSHLIV